MRGLYILWAMIVALSVEAQIQETLSTKSNEIYVEAKWGDIDFISTDAKDISITGSAEINFGENNDWFRVSTKMVSGKMHVIVEVDNEDRVREMITLYDGAEKIEIEGKRGWEANQRLIRQQFPDRTFTMTSIRKAISIDLTIAVPRDKNLSAYLEFGDATILSMDNEMDIQTKHGFISASFDSEPNYDTRLASIHDFVEVSLPNSVKAKISLSTRHGLIYTNFESSQLSLDPNTGFDHCFIGNLNRGDEIALELVSKHDNVYLRGVR